MAGENIPTADEKRIFYIDDQNFMIIKSLMSNPCWYYNCPNISLYE